jgi:hypothetical protein
MMRKVVLWLLGGAIVAVLLVLAIQEDEKRIGPRYPVPTSTAMR